jgi:hypothetical protein
VQSWLKLQGAGRGGIPSPTLKNRAAVLQLSGGLAAGGLAAVFDCMCPVKKNTWMILRCEVTLMQTNCFY